MSKPISVTLPFKKETKNSWQFQAEGDQHLIPTLYVKKSAFDSDTPPASITLTVKAN